jgi:hypothetical protein
MRKPPKVVVELYKDRKGRGRWRTKRCGKITANGGEDFVGRGVAGARRAWTSFAKSLVTAEIEVVVRK